MESVNVLYQMAEYDFNCPIDVTMIFEDSDDDTSSSKDTLSDGNMNDDSTHKDVAIQRVSESLKENESSEYQTNFRSLNQLIINKISQKILSYNENQKSIDLNGEKGDNNLNNDKNIEKNGINQNNATPNYGSNISNESQHAFNESSNTGVNQDCNRDTVLNISQINDQQLDNTFIEELLNKVSEHVVLIMRSFYHYGAKRTPNVGDNRNREKIFHFIRNHFFELSYNTVETIILPHEQNENFINHFLDKTVEIAKTQNWKCHRGHVQPFFRDLIRWTKLKRDYIKKCAQQPSNENVILKQHLGTPLQPFKLPQSQNKSVTSPTIQNNLCIFSSGAPGSEISINVNPNVLKNVTETLYSGEWNRNNNYNNYLQNENTAAPQPYENQYSNVQNNNTICNRPPPPPYHMHQNSNNFTQMPRKQCKKTKKLCHHYHNKEQLSPVTNKSDQQPTYHHNYESMAQPMQNYQNQVHYINSSQASPTDNSFNSLHNNINAQTHEAQMNSGPVITNVTSYAPKTRAPSYRCHMCGKYTSAPKAPYNHPSKPVYCSYLCQELESQFYKPACS